MAGEWYGKWALVTGSSAGIGRALAAGKSYVISGTGNYLSTHAQRLAPRRMVSRIIAGMFRPEEQR